MTRVSHTPRLARRRDVDTDGRALEPTISELLTVTRGHAIFHTKIDNRQSTEMIYVTGTGPTGRSPSALARSPYISYYGSTHETTLYRPVRDPIPFVLL